MKRKFTLLLLSALTATTLLAQTADRKHLGYMEIAGYPYCDMEQGLSSYSIVTDHVTPIQFQGPTYFIKEALNPGCSYMDNIYNPEGVDIVIAVNNLFESESDIHFMKLRDKRPPLREKAGHTSTIKVSDVTLFASQRRQNPVKPAPSGPQVVGRAIKEVGFEIEVTVKGELTFADTIYVMMEYESAPQADEKMVEEDLHAQMAGLNLKNELTKYKPYLSRIIGAAPLTSYTFRGYAVKVKKKCTIDYSDINKAFDEFETAFDYVKKRQWNIDEFKEKAAPSVQVWEEALAQSDVNNEKAKINKEITPALYYNLGVYSALCKDFSGAANYFKKSDDTLPDFGNALEMYKLAQTWINAQNEYIKRLTGK